MTKSSFLVRVATVVVALPLFAVLIFFLPFYNHLALNIAVVVAAALGSREVELFARKKGVPVFPYVFTLAALIPAITYLEVVGVFAPLWSTAAFSGLLIVTFSRLLWVRREQGLQLLMQQVSTSLLVLIYPALFLSFIVRLTSLKNASLVLLFFFSMNFANDIMAYLFGSFLGRRSKLNYPVSPNKSILGFVAGCCTAVLVAYLFRALFPQLLPIGCLATGLFGACIGILTIAGDLVESALKRAAAVKDSGVLIPGRGGVLDSIDSWLFTAPALFFFFMGIS